MYLIHILPERKRNVLHNNSDPANIPCHRVMKAKGEVATHFAFGGAKGQRDKLEKEGIIFGLCVKMFSVAGPVIVNGVAISVVVGLIYLII